MGMKECILRWIQKTTTLSEVNLEITLYLSLTLAQAMLFMSKLAALCTANQL